MSKRLNHTVKSASLVGVVGSAVNFGLETYTATRYGGRSPLADAPHQFADIFSYGVVLASRFMNRSKQAMEKLSSWIVSTGSFAVGYYIGLETAIQRLEGPLQPIDSRESVTLASVLVINGIIHHAQKNAHRLEHDGGSLANHVHAESECYATAALLGGTILATAFNSPELERAAAVGTAWAVAYFNNPERIQTHGHGA